MIAGREIYSVPLSLIFVLSLCVGCSQAAEKPFVVRVDLQPISSVHNRSQSILQGSIRLGADLLFNSDGSWSVIPRNCELKDVSCSWDTFLCEEVSLKEEKTGQYSLVVKKLKSKSITFNDIMVQLQFYDTLCTFSGLTSPDLGEAFSAAGTCTYRLGRQTNVTLDANVSKMSLSKIARLLQKDEQMSADGLFSGTIRGSLIGGSPVLSVVLFNETPGSIRIQKDVPFLEKRLSDQYYRLLIENFRDYQYNKGDFLITGTGKDITLHGRFESDQGKRDIEIVFHDVFTHGAKK